MPDAGARLVSGRHAGVLIPLFSIPSTASWGIGEIPDLARLARWLEEAGLAFVQLLPVNEMQEGQNSPYSALSAMAVDPIFISLDAVEEFAEAGGEAALSGEQRRCLDRARTARAVDYDAVRSLKSQAFRKAFASFYSRHWQSGSSRDRDFRLFREREHWWLDDYALFRALHEEFGSSFWEEWPDGVREAGTQAVNTARNRLAVPVLYFEYLQWLADEQWRRTRRDCGSIGIFGDFPFMVSGHSADVWKRQHEFRVDASVGVPPDAFSATGQDWGLPAYRWDAIARTDYQWLRDRARRCAELYDGFRVDHLVGFYRTFVRERDGSTFFVPESEADQLAQGEQVMALLAGCGSRILAEDLGTVPDFVRASMARLGIPGLKVLRWEREWHVPGQPFRDPAGYPAVSVAISGTHDTETMAEWWDRAGEDERRLFAEVPLVRELGGRPDLPYSDTMRDVLLETLFAAGSDLAIVPMQDVFGWRDRINTPASVGQQNWTWRLPWPVEELTTGAVPGERSRFLRDIARKHGRL